MTHRDQDRPSDGFDASSIPDHLPTLDVGRHGPAEGKMCAMEAAAWLSGEEWTDHPRTVHPVIARVARGTNDRSADADRQRLWPFIMASLGTARPRQPLLTWRLDHRARRVLARCPDDWRGAWEALLALHAELTGHRPGPVPLGRLERLDHRLRSLR